MNDPLTLVVPVSLHLCHNFVLFVPSGFSSPHTHPLSSPSLFPISILSNLLFIMNSNPSTQWLPHGIHIRLSKSPSLLSSFFFCSSSFLSPRMLLSLYSSVLTPHSFSFFHNPASLLSSRATSIFCFINGDFSPLVTHLHILGGVGTLISDVFCEFSKVVKLTEKLSAIGSLLYPHLHLELYIDH